MLAFVYRSKKKDEMYLYLSIRDDFSSIPEALLKLFGKPEFALQLNLKKRKQLSRVDIIEVKAKLKSDGFYLQMPPVIHQNKADK